MSFCYGGFTVDNEKQIQFVRPTIKIWEYKMCRIEFIEYFYQIINAENKNIYDMSGN